MKLTTVLAVLLSASTVVFAAPAGFTARDVWVPSITYPTAGTIWMVRQTYKVEWSLDQKPSNVSNPVGTLYLIKGGHGDADNPLADGFLLSDGFAFVTITVIIPTSVSADSVNSSAPTGTTANSSASTSIIAGNDYQIALLTGGSGSASPMFQITY